jgi:hypothetical protein
LKLHFYPKFRCLPHEGYVCPRRPVNQFLGDLFLSGRSMAKALFGQGLLPASQIFVAVANACCG